MLRYEARGSGTGREEGLQLGSSPSPAVSGCQGGSGEGPAARNPWLSPTSSECPASPPGGWGLRVKAGASNQGCVSLVPSPVLKPKRRRIRTEMPRACPSRDVGLVGACARKWGAGPRRPWGSGGLVLPSASVGQCRRKKVADGHHHRGGLRGDRTGYRGPAVPGGRARAVSRTDRCVWSA